MLAVIAVLVGVLVAASADAPGSPPETCTTSPAASMEGRRFLAEQQTAGDRELLALARNQLGRSERGRQLVQLADRQGILVVFSPVDTSAETGAYLPDLGVVLLSRRLDRNTVADTLAHELRHATRGIIPDSAGVRFWRREDFVALMMADEAAAYAAQVRIAHELAEAGVVPAGAAQQTYMAMAMAMDSYLVLKETFEAAVRAGASLDDAERRAAAAFTQVHGLQHARYLSQYQRMYEKCGRTFSAPKNSG